MTTHERELTEPVDLCVVTGPGSVLNPAARGWSRHPIHRCNLVGEHGRNKRWDYWAILAGDLVVSVVHSNTDRLGLADVWWFDLAGGAEGGGSAAARDGVGFDLPERPGTEPIVLERRHFSLAMVDGPEGTRITSDWLEADGTAGRLDVTVARPAGHESLNVVIPWSDDTFNFTSKHQARAVTGWLRVGDRRWPIGGDAGDAWGVLDVGRGRWPSEITWNWGGGAGRCSCATQHVVGLQFGAKWTTGTGFTENGVLVDGRLSKIGRELDWTYDWDDPMQPWRVHDPGGQLDVVLRPRYDKHSKLEGRKRRSETHQVFGTWSGRVVDDDGVEHELRDAPGFAEEARQVW